MTTQQEFLIECIVNDIALWLIQERSFSLLQALNAIYNSQTFEKLQNPATGLLSESSAYNYDLLITEMRHGKLIQEDF